MTYSYLLKVNGTTFPLQYMVIPTYEVAETPIIIDDYYDTAYNRHIIKASATDLRITFNCRAGFEDDRAAIAAFFDSVVDEYTIKYYNPSTGAYSTDTFTIDETGLDNFMNRVSNSEGELQEFTISLVRKAAE